MNAPILWVLNLDAEHELASRAYTSNERIEERISTLRTKLSLLAPADQVWTPGLRVRGTWMGRAWCPTPRALARLSAAGAVVPSAPSYEVLRMVNHRRFCAELGQTLPGARYVLTQQELEETIAQNSPTGHWLLKRPMSFAGRGRRRVAQGVLEPAAEPWVRASLSNAEGLQVEPWVDRLGDYALHGFLSREGRLVLGRPTAQTCDLSGAWQASTIATELSLEEEKQLHATAEQSAYALQKAGYFGPFGVDAFRWRAAEGPAFCTRCELNARYSMGWSVGMGALRPDREC